MVDYITELFFDGVWNDITPDVRNSDPIKISRGRKDWASETDPATCALKLNNGASRAAMGVSGRYSPRNPRSDLFGKIGRNTPLRVRYGTPTAQVARIIGDSQGYAETTSDAITGPNVDVDLRLDIDPDSWDFEGNQAVFFGNVINGGPETGCYLFLEEDRTLRFVWSDDGDNLENALSTAALPILSGRNTIRVTLDGNNGAGGNTAAFYYGDDIDAGPWTQIGADVTQAGTSQVWNASVPIRVGSIDSNDPLQSLAPGGRLHGFQYRSSIGGTAMIDVDFTGIDPSATSFTDGDGNVWMLSGVYPEVDPVFRFTGEISKWPVKWDLSGADVWIPITASGILRRLQRGTKPLRSALFRSISGASTVAYWPCEEGSEATRFYSGKPGDSSSLTFTTGQVSPANDDSLPASDPLPTVADGTIFGDVPAYPVDDVQRVASLVKLPTAGFASNKLIFRFLTSGTAARFDIFSIAGDDIRIDVFDETGASIFSNTITSAAFELYGQFAMFALQLRQDGADILSTLSVTRPGDTNFTTSSSTITGQTFGRFTKVFLGSTNDMEGSTFGHCFILTGDNASLFFDTIRGSLRAWSGDTSMGRMARLGFEEGIPVGFLGEAGDTETMGPQRSKRLVELMLEAPASDLGVFTDRTEGRALFYRSRADLYTQTPALTLDYADGIISDPFDPVDDDQSIRNEVTVVRDLGASVTAVQETGSLSIEDPPDGVGKYDVQQTISLDTDERLPEQAAWRLHLGTVDESRFPVLRLDLRNPRASLLIDDVLAVREGDIIKIDNPPAWLPGGPYLLLVEGIEEEKTKATHVIEFNCSPGSAWTVGSAADDAEDPGPDEPKRADTALTISAGATTSTATSITFTTVSGPFWTTSADDLPFDVMFGGERMRVTAITAPSGSDQTFTVVRSINGVVKVHAAATTMSLYQPSITAL